ncbi:hypothetical protein F5Y06DRAFT_225912 [Hypoxylon sp. FL0890]|nr:hypothetical protein F5Y06DRAFT_225912 [Hypoxylon sp. FL0890]
MSSSSRFFINPSETLRTADANKELLSSLDRITTYNPPVHTCSTGWTFQGFYSGPTSIAYLFYRLSQIFPDLEFKQQSLLDWAEAYLSLGARLKKKTPDPSHCGIANETLAHLALTAVMQRDASLVRQICSFETVLNDEGEEGSNEWLYGRAGYLYFLRLCRTIFKDGNASSSTASALDNTIKKTVTRILAAPQPWTWHGKQYFGAAHGAIGIICQVVSSRPSTAPKLQNLLSSLLDQQLDSGNFPSSAGSESDRLVQFCHGGPGFIISLKSLIPHFPELQSKIEDAMANAAKDIWQRGLLTKQPCLCHGIAGNALALDGGEERLMHFVSFMGTDALEKVGWLREAGRHDEFVGLYTGEAGRAWTWAVAASRGPKVCIAYNDL